MPSPFPGMDPWLESPWIFPGVHQRLIAGICDALNAVLPPPYFADIGNRVVLAEDDPPLRPNRREPDVSVLKPVGANGSHGPAGGGGIATAVAEATSVLVPVPAIDPGDETTEWLIEVRTGDGVNDLVTAVELLSPTNKGGGRSEFRAKQRALAGRGVNLVEIDLLRRGRPATSVPPAAAARVAGAFDYHACVFRPDAPAHFEVYPIQLSQRLPTVRVPLRLGADAVAVGLQAAFDRCYDAMGYARRVRYADPPDPPLTPEQRAWAEGILKAKGVLA